MSATIDEQFIEYVVKTIVGNPDAVSIARSVDEKGVLLELTVDPEDLGRVIGKRGAGAQALRTLLRALGTKNDARYNLKIIDVGGERPARPAQQPVRDANDDTSSDGDSDDQVTQTQTQSSDEPGAVAVVDTSSEDLAETEEDANDDQVFADEQEADESQSNLDKTRRELADLDDLDI